MKGALIEVSGNWAHFKKPETNNNPLTHDFITKTALIGLIGAVLGIERDAMKVYFQQLSEDLLYGVQVKNAIKKESWAFTLRRASDLFVKAPKQMEFLRYPCFIVAVALNASRSQNLFDQFISAIENSESKYTPVLGLHNCPANLSLIEKGLFLEEKGNFETKGFVTKNMKFDMVKLIGEKSKIRYGFDRIPTYQNDDFWNLPDKYVEVVYPTEQNKLSILDDKYYKFSDGSVWILI